MRDLPVLEDPWIGSTLDERFEVLALLGKGGMGAIYRCRDTESGREMAIKIILDELASDPEVQARFAREIQANIGVDHPNVVRTLGNGRTADGLPYFAMELLQGRPMDEVLDDDGEMATEQVAHLGAQIARGLQAIHDAGIVHRDLKPENVVVHDSGMAQVFDFGLSLHQPPDGAPDVAVERLTEMDRRIGTPMYMAPEYIQGGELDARCDLYALGVILYECCTGRPPFNGSAYQVIDKHVNQTPKTIEERVPGRHPAWMRKVVESLLEKDPAKRPQTADAVATLLTRPPELNQPFQTLDPVAAPVERTPEPPIRAPEPTPQPSAEPAEPQPESGWAALLKRIFPFLFAASVIWHAFSVGIGVGSAAPPIGREVASWQAAAETAARGQNPYDVQAVNRTAIAMGRSGKVARTFAPPSWLLAMSWTRPLPARAARATWIGLQESFLFASLLLLARWQGAATGAVALAAAAAMGAVPLAMEAGSPVFALLLLLTFGFGTRSEIQRGFCLGLAGLVSLRVWILLPLLVARREWTALLIAGLVAVGGLLLTIPTLGFEALGGFFGSAVPDLLAGDFRGLGLRTDVFGNLSLPSVIDSLLPGPSGQQLSPAALGMSWAGGLATIGALSWAHRASGDPLAEASAVGTWLLALIVLPVHGPEALLPLALPAIALCITGLARGRLDGRLAIPVGLALALLLYPVEPLRVFGAQVLTPGLPWLAPLLAQGKLAAVLLIGACTLTLSLGGRSEYPPAT